MAKIVYNNCYGGFSISDEAIRRYAEIKGLTLYPEPTQFGFMTYWIAAPEDRSDILMGVNFNRASMEDRIASNAAYKAKTLSERDIERNDPVLVQVVEELGPRANGSCASLAIEEIPAGTLYRIDEYDGNESVMTQDMYDWKIAN